MSAGELPAETPVVMLLHSGITATLSQTSDADSLPRTLPAGVVPFGSYNLAAGLNHLSVSSDILVDYNEYISVWVLACFGHFCCN